MTDLTQKENFLRCLNGQIPQSVPIYNMGFPAPEGADPTRAVRCSLFKESSRSREGGYDIWGVHYVSNPETNYGSIPEPNNFLLDDITKWRDVIKAPEVPDVDWEAMAKSDYEASRIDRDTRAVLLNCGYSPFQRLVAFMGFTETLCVLYEEPEEVKALNQYMLDFYVPIIEKQLDYYKPDVFYMADDTASKYNPFFSPEIYEEIYLPVYRALAKPANDRGIPIGFHNCGRCEPFVDWMVDFGVRMWDPSQTTNKLEEIKQKYLGKLTLAGTFEYVTTDRFASVDELREAMHEDIDKFAPGGSFMFMGGVMSQAGDTEARALEKVVIDLAIEYCDHYYEKH